MRRIIYVGVVFQLIIISILGIEFLSDKYIDELLYSNTTSIALNFD